VYGSGGGAQVQAETALGVDIKCSPCRGDKLLVQPSLDSCEFRARFRLDQLTQIRQQRGGHGFRIGSACKLPRFMDSRGHESIPGPIDPIGLKKLGERRDMLIMGITWAHIAHTPNDRRDEVRGMDTGDGHAKGDANMVPLAGIWV
jgi:hypothetical protein